MRRDTNRRVVSPLPRAQKFDRLVKKGGDLRVEDALTEIEGFQGAVLLPSGASVTAWTRVADEEAADDAGAKAILRREMNKSAGEFARLWSAMATGEQALRDFAPGLTFDSMMSTLSTFHVLQALPATEAEPYIRFRCTCRYHQDKGKCKHAMREGMRSSLFAVPEEMQLGVIGREAKVGRRKATTKAGLLQPGEQATLGGQLPESDEPDRSAEPEAPAPEPESEPDTDDDPWVENFKDE